MALSEDGEYWECPECGAHVDPSWFDDHDDCPECDGAGG